MLVAGAVAAFGTPAFADDKVGVAVGPSTFDLNPSESRDFGVDVTNKLTTPNNKRDISIVVQSPSALSQDLVITGKTAGCTGSGPSVSCTVSFNAGESKSFTFSIAAKSTVSVGAGQSKQGNGTVTASGLGGEGGQDSKQINVTVRGPQGSPVVPEVSGTVVDSTTAAPIRDAEVTLTDGAGAPHKRGSDANGRFKFTSTSGDPIAPGSLNIIAAKDGFVGIQKNVEGRAGQSLAGQRIQLKPIAATASAEPPTTGPTDTAAPTSGDTAPAAASGNGSGGTGLFSWVLIGLGGLLVLLGIGAIVLLLVRRKDDEPDDEPDDGHGRRGPSPVPAARGAYHGAPGAEPTMVAGRGGPADATAMIRPTRPGGYPDPYAASPQPAYPPTSNQGPPGYGGSAYTGGGGGYALPAYGAPPAEPAYPPTEPGYPPANGYGADPGGYGGAGRPGARGGEDYDAGYGGSGGYGASGGYSGPTRPASPAGYPASPAGYPASPAGYGSGGAGGYSGDPRGGYDEPTGRYSGAGGGHAAPPGYGQSGGYDAGYDRGSGGYDRRPDHEAGYDRGGPPYDRVPEEREGYRSDYGTSDGYYDDPAAAPSRRTSPSSRADRRSLDWLDD